MNHYMTEITEILLKIYRASISAERLSILGDDFDFDTLYGGQQYLDDDKTVLLKWANDLASVNITVSLRLTHFILHKARAALLQNYTQLVNKCVLPSHPNRWYH